MLADGPCPDPDPVKTAKRLVRGWYTAQAKANHGPVSLGYGAMISITPDPVKLAVLGAFDYLSDRDQDRDQDQDQDHDSHVRCWAMAKARDQYPDTNRDWIPRWREFARLVWGESRFPSALVAPVSQDQNQDQDQDHDSHVRAYRMAMWAARKAPVVAATAECTVTLAECGGWVGRVEGALDSGPLARAACGHCHTLLPLAAEPVLSRIHKHGTGAYTCPSCGARNGIE
jgi:hypothetical protein